MKLLLNNSGNIDFSCKEDLAKAIPIGFQGKPINYGQGEGQVEIDGTVWGFYLNSDGSYYMVFEEGVVGWVKIDALVHGIINALTKKFGEKISVTAEGPFTNDPNV